MGSSPGFGSNPDNTPSLVETRPLASFPSVALLLRFTGYALRRGAGSPGTEAGDRVSIMSGVLSGLDPKPGELPMDRLKFR